MNDAKDEGDGKPRQPRRYEVGYSRPPKEHQWRPGECGNPKGRPRGAKSFDAEVRRLLKRKVTVKKSGKVRKVTVVEANFERILHKAMEGDTRAMLMIQELARQYLPEDIKAFEELREEDRQIVARWLAKSSQSSGGSDGKS
jgi:hypothetical protein